MTPPGMTPLAGDPRRAAHARFDRREDDANEMPARRAGDPSARGIIKAMFRLAAKAAAMRDEDQPKSRQRKKRGETEGEFRQFVRRILRRSDLRPQFRRGAAKAGSRGGNLAPENFTASGFAASPWCNPLNGLDFYGGDLGGFGDSNEAFDPGPDQVSFEPDF
jgi:hypothetical protein